MKLSVSIPTSLNEITLRQYKELLKIQENAENETHLHAKIIQILCKMNISDVMLLKASDCQVIVENYGFIPQLDEISLGEYIDLDTFIGDWDNIEKAMNVLYRPIVLKSKDKYTIDEYKLGTDDLLLDMPMNAVLSSIFGSKGVPRLDSQSNFNAKYGWYQSIFGLAQGDIRRFEDITKLNVHECFMMLSFMKEKAELETKRIKKNFK